MHGHACMAAGSMHEAAYGSARPVAPHNVPGNDTPTSFIEATGAFTMYVTMRFVRLFILDFYVQSFCVNESREIEMGTLVNVVSRSDVTGYRPQCPPVNTPATDCLDQSSQIMRFLLWQLSIN